jgi:hypothetical protein
MTVRIFLPLRTSVLKSGSGPLANPLDIAGWPGLCSHRLSIE